MKKYFFNKYPILFVLIFGFLIRLVSMDQSLWLDEATSAILVRDFSFYDIVTRFSPGDFHPPLYYILLKLWTYVFGTSEIGLRSLSLVLGVLSVFVLYKLVVLLFNKKVALVSSLLLATSGLHIYFSQEARMYIMASFFVLLAIYYFVKINKTERVGDYILFPLSVFLLSATHYLAILIIPAFWIYGLLEKKKFIWFKKLLTSHIIVFIFGLLWFPTFLNQLLVGGKAKINSPLWWATLGKSNLKDAFLVPVKFIIGRVSWDNKYIYGLIVFLLVSFFGLLIFDGYKKWRRSGSFKLVALWILIPFTLSFILGFWFSVFSYFRLLFILPAFYVLVSLGIMSLKGKKQVIVLALILLINILLSCYYFVDPKFHREDWRGLVEKISQSGNLKDSMVIFVTYNQREAFKYYDTSRKIKVNGPALIYHGYRIIWLMRYVQPIFDPEDKVRSQIEALGYNKVGEYNFNGVIVWKYIK